MRSAFAPPLALPLVLACVAACSRASDPADRATREPAADPPSAEGDAAAQPAPTQRAELDDEEARARWESRPAALLADELQAYSMMMPVLVTHCARCHHPGEPEASDEALHHFSMDGFPPGGHHAHEIDERVRAALGLDGSDPTMPKDDPGVLSEEELELVSAWAAAFARAKATGIAHHAEQAD